MNIEQQRTPEDYYGALGVAKHATAQEIKDAYKEIARLNHPDVSDSANIEKFKKAAEAYGVLSDTDKKAAYDRSIYNGPPLLDASSIDPQFFEKYPGLARSFIFDHLDPNKPGAYSIETSLYQQKETTRIEEASSDLKTRALNPFVMPSKDRYILHEDIPNKLASEIPVWFTPISNTPEQAMIKNLMVRCLTKLGASFPYLYKERKEGELLCFLTSQSDPELIEKIEQVYLKTIGPELEIAKNRCPLMTTLLIASDIFPKTLVTPGFAEYLIDTLRDNASWVSVKREKSSSYLPAVNLTDSLAPQGFNPSAFRINIINRFYGGALRALADHFAAGTGYHLEKSGDGKSLAVLSSGSLIAHLKERGAIKGP